MPTDLLSAILRDTGLSRRLLDLSTLPETRAVRFPCERSIGLHMVLRGPVHLHAADLPEGLALAGGDVVVMARGCDHVLSRRPRLTGLRIDRIDVRDRADVRDGPNVLDATDDAPADRSGAGAKPPGGDGVGQGGADGRGEDQRGRDQASAVLSGAYQFWHAPLHPFFAEIPAWTVLRATDLPRLGPLALTGDLLAQELRGVEGSADTGAGAEAGSDIVTHGLLDLVFTYALRQIIALCAATSAGWSQAVRDPQVGRVVARMHDDPAHPWTLDELARAAGLSRTALAERFRDVMGDTPLQHLRTVRMQRAIRLLSETRGSLEAVANAVGYQDAFSFSKVFKRTLGMSPKSFRQRDAAERHDPWRFQAG